MCRIGVTTSFKTIDVLEEKTNKNYMTAITNAGGIPVLITPETVENGFSLLKDLDGILITGGFDLDPGLFDQEPHEELSDLDRERDQLEMNAVKVAEKNRIPVLGICRGMQIINIVYGGTLDQHINSHIEHNQDEENHVPTHEVEIYPGTQLQKIFGGSEIKVNSHHHQRVEELGKNLEAVAEAPDGTTEALIHEKHRFIRAVQWHPEMMYRKYEEQEKLFENFIDQCRETKKSM